RCGGCLGVAGGQVLHTGDGIALGSDLLGRIINVELGKLGLRIVEFKTPLDGFPVDVGSFFRDAFSFGNSKVGRATSILMALENIQPHSPILLKVEVWSDPEAGMAGNPFRLLTHLP